MDYDFSKLGSLNAKDVGKGVLMAALGAILGPVMQSMAVGALVVNPATIGLAALSAGFSYLLKNLATGDNGKLLQNK
mgnify:CR=1 FL=1